MPGQLDVLVAHGFEIVVVGRRDRGRRLAVGHHEPGRLGGLRLTARLLAAGPSAHEHLHGELAHHHPPAAAEAHGPAGLDEPGRPGPRGRGLGEADQVELAGRTEPAGARRRDDEVVALPEGQDGRDVAVGDDPGHQGPAFGLADHVRAGAGLVVGIFVGEVPVDVDAARRILVDEAVAVVVDPFRKELDRRPSRPSSGRPSSSRRGSSGSATYSPPAAGTLIDRDEAVAVEVLGAVLVDPAVVVVVERVGVGPSARS